MEKFFNPQSVVIIGASNSPSNLGKTICNFLTHIKYKGKIYVVNKNGENVGGCHAYINILDIPGDIELGIIFTPAKVVPLMMKKCGEKGVKNIIIESAGFSEKNAEGQRIQEEIDFISSAYGIRYLGPNCFGVISTHNRFSTFFGIFPGAFDELFDNPGKISYVIQSGAIGTIIMDFLKDDVIKINKIVSIGNKANIDETDVLEYLRDDNTEVIGMYLENIQSGKKFLDVAKSVKKPILVYKVGKTNAGVRAAISHTAGMVNNDLIFDSACRQAGIVRLQYINELYSIPKIFSMPPLKGTRIAIFTNSGALGGIIADMLIEAGFKVPLFSDGLQKKLKKKIDPPSISNPIDVGPITDFKIFQNIFLDLLSSKEVDCIFAAHNLWQKDVIYSIIDLFSLGIKYQKPVAIYLPISLEKIISIRTEYQIPIFESLQEAVTALSISHQHFIYMSRR